MKIALQAPFCYQRKPLFFFFFFFLSLEDDHILPHLFRPFCLALLKKNPIFSSPTRPPPPPTIPRVCSKEMFGRFPLSKTRLYSLSKRSVGSFLTSFLLLCSAHSVFPSFFTHSRDGPGSHGPVLIPTPANFFSWKSGSFCFLFLFFVSFIFIPFCGFWLSRVHEPPLSDLKLFKDFFVCVLG